MQYRVIRDIGVSDYIVGSTFDGAAMSPDRIRQLVEQRRIEPLEDPEGSGVGTTALVEQRDALAAERDALAAQVAALTEQLAAAGQSGDDPPPGDGDRPQGDEPPSGEAVSTGGDQPAGSVPPDLPIAEDLAALNRDELRALAAERGIEGAGRMTKPELLARLTAKEGQDGQPAQ